MAIISFLKPAEYIEIASMKASLKLLNLDVQGQLDVLRPFLLVQLHFFFFAQLSGRHFSDDLVEFFFLIQCCEGQSTVQLSIQVKCQKKVFFDVDAEHGIPCYLLWRSICLLVTIFLHPTRNCIQWSNSDVLVVTN